MKGGSNHLGNVLVVISDKVKLYSRDKVTLDSARAEVVSASDYYPGGLEMKGRSYSSTYRYGFNGKEKDNSFSTATNYDYGFRIYNPQIARFLSVDPLTNKFPMLTPYQFANNSPIRNVDLDGAEELPNEIFNAAARAGKAVIQKATHYAIAKAVDMTLDYVAVKISEKIEEKTTPAQAQAIGMTGEFVFGVGPEKRYFGPNEPITQDLMKSKLTGEARDAFYEQNKDALAKGDFKAVTPVSEVFSFGVKELLTEGGNAQQFVGSANYNITLGADNKTLNFTITNKTSKNSLMYHGKIPLVDATSHTRDAGAAMGTTSQTYESSEPLQIPKK